MKNANMKKKILILSLDYYPPPVGGAEVAIKEITDRISPQDIEFHMVTLHYDRSYPRVEQIDNVLVHRIGLGRKDPPKGKLKESLRFDKMYFQFGAAWKALRLHRKYQYDALWAMMAHSTGVPATLFNLICPTVPYALTLQEGDPPEHVEKVMRPLWPLFTRSFKAASIIQPISSFLGEWARRRGFQGPMEIIPNGASSQNFKQDVPQSELEQYRKKIGKQKGDVFLISVSRLVHKNATDDVVRALAFLPKHVKLLIVGSGPDEEMLKSLVHELKLEDRVQFTGQVERDETAAYRRVSDIFIRPSRSEGFGNSLASTMAARLPVISTQEGGIADFLYDRKRNPDKPTTGWAVDKDSPEQIAEAVEDILAHPDVVKEVTDRAYEMVYKTYNWDFIAKDMQKKVFERITK